MTCRAPCVAGFGCRAIIIIFVGMHSLIDKQMYFKLATHVSRDITRNKASLQ